MISTVAVSTLAGFMGMGMVELIVLGILGILLFGKRLPEIGKNLGKTIVEFKKGLNDTSGEISKALDEGETSKPALQEPKTTVTSGRQIKRIAGTTDEP